MLSLIFLIAFPFALWKAWQNVQLAKASTGWPTTSGTVTASEHAKVMFRKQPRVTYSYCVNGAPFTSNRISFAGGYPPKETDAILARFPFRREVVVSYAPDNPAEATLETGSNRQVTAQLRILLIFFVLIILMNILNFYLKYLDKETKPSIRTYGIAQVIDPRSRPGEVPGRPDSIAKYRSGNYGPTPRDINEIGGIQTRRISR